MKPQHHMLRIAFALSFALFSSILSNAQRNRVNVAIQYYRSSLQQSTTLDTMAEYTFRGIEFLPSIGYQRILKNNLGFRIDVGRRKFSVTETSTQRNPDQNFYSIQRRSVKSTTLFVCPALLESAQWQKYEFVASISLPVEYRSNFISSLRQTDYHYAPNELYRSTELENKVPDLLEIGLFFNGGINRKIYKNLYGGVQFGIGFYHDYSKGSVQVFSKETVDGVETILQDNRDYKPQTFDGYMSFKPLFCIQYGF